jgi:hypothetical protein
MVAFLWYSGIPLQASLSGNDDEQIRNGRDEGGQQQ